METSWWLSFAADGYRKNAGKLAKTSFGEYGPAGGHKEAARAEMPGQKSSPSRGAGVHLQNFDSDTHPTFQIVPYTWFPLPWCVRYCLHLSRGVRHIMRTTLSLSEPTPRPSGCGGGPDLPATRCSMYRPSTLAMILAGGRVDELGVLTHYRPKSAVPFGGFSPRYRFSPVQFASFGH